VGELHDLHWFVVFNGIADRWLWGFDADGWRLLYDDPAMGCLGILPLNGNSPATLEDARWLADVFAFDHDAPVGISPAWQGEPANLIPIDAAAHPVIQPVCPFPESMTKWYWESLNMSLGAAADLRFNGSYVIRYEDEARAPSTDFSSRFAGREQWVALYAMAARQPDPLSEYLCMYRVLEAADHGNGKGFSAANLPLIGGHDFGHLKLIADVLEDVPAVDGFEIYKRRALTELRRLKDAGVNDVPSYLYRIRNSLAHGRRGILTDRHHDRSIAAGHALPIVKLLARIAIEPGPE
jgi:hypothetical protein